MENVYLLRWDQQRGCTEMLCSSRVWKYDSRRPVRILDDWCMMHGSTMKGRTDAVRAVLGYQQKIPVMISERSQQIYFPLFGMNRADNIWVQYRPVLLMRGSTGLFCEIQFDNGIRVPVDCDRRTIQKQLSRCGEIIAYLNRLDHQIIREVIQ